MLLAVLLVSAATVYVTPVHAAVFAQSITTAGSTASIEPTSTSAISTAPYLDNPSLPSPVVSLAADLGNQEPLSATPAVQVALATNHLTPQSRFLVTNKVSLPTSLPTSLSSTAIPDHAAASLSVSIHELAATAAAAADLPDLPDLPDLSDLSILPRLSSGTDTTLQAFKANDWHLGGVRHVCMCLILAAIFSRFMFFSVDPYSIDGMANPILSRIILSTFYLFFILAYVIMGLHWVCICRTALVFKPSRTLPISKLAVVLILLVYVTLEIVISLAQAQKKENIGLFISDMLFMGAAMVIVMPLYIYYGRLFVNQLKTLRKDRLGHRDRMISKVRVMSFGPVIAGTLSIIITFLKFTFLQKNPFLFLIGESISHFVELISMALFMYGILLSPQPAGGLSSSARRRLTRKSAATIRLKPAGAL
ncbi:hypothetical protein BSLG_001541 [Batrachochytrium salamandrivorans]|nr:hypothetical protein BSLG_001541 [Batrachochytrium salamandrivorans]